MKAFEYAAPSTKEQAVSLLGNQWGETEILAGGTDLLSLMKDYLSTPKRVVNIKEIKELQGDPLYVCYRFALGGAGCREELLDNPNVKKEYVALAEAVEGVRSQQIRNLGTVGGDLCQRPRCWYFRSGFGYFPKGEGGEDLIPHGENRYHAILGNSGPAYFVNPSSLAPALVALDARFGCLVPKVGATLRLSSSLSSLKAIPKESTS
jgi:xanthine dehydrogenase YagS FAD-binding subunit